MLARLRLFTIGEKHMTPGRSRSPMLLGCSPAGVPVAVVSRALSPHPDGSKTREFQFEFCRSSFSILLGANPPLPSARTST